MIAVSVTAVRAAILVQSELVVKAEQHARTVSVTLDNMRLDKWHLGFTSCRRYMGFTSCKGRFSIYKMQMALRLFQLQMALAVYKLQAALRLYELQTEPGVDKSQTQLRVYNLQTEVRVYKLQTELRFYKAWTCLQSMVQHIRRCCDGKDHEEEDEQASLPVVGANMLCGIKNSPHQPTCSLFGFSK